ncbi:MAG: DNA repair protein RecN [Actinomycetaceae bacterium]|nr:DNA repair protein RecN [Arcanobacterium sp.]MDD7504403.1 DNA repair protein RecN [Actinomycetaceae bacterium]MDY6143591.1 DNA repair protein RecN [Arcanobacterium sp.]
MISELTIRNLGVIEQAHIHIGDGLNALTGETGAGKTMALTAIQLLMGGKADPGKVRHGAERSDVEGIFIITEESPVAQIVAEAGGTIDFEDGVGELVVARTVPAEGRSRAIVGGRTVPVSVLRNIAEHELTIHGQADQMRLTSRSEQRRALDAYGGEAHDCAMRRYEEAWRQYISCQKELEDFDAYSQARGAERLALQALVSKVEELDPHIGEDDALKQRALRLENVETVREVLVETTSLLDGTTDVEGASGLIDRAAHSLSRLNDEAFVAHEQQLRDASVLLSDISRELSEHLASLDADPGELDSIYSRRSALKSVQIELGMTIEQMLAQYQRAQERLAALSDPQARHSELEQELKDAQTALRSAGAKLSRLRSKAAQALEEHVTRELADLNMKGTTFKVALVALEEPTPTGYENVEFRLATHGAGEIAVHKAASGGEISRIMLALEVTLAERGGETGRTFVFDEVDAGIGGETALRVGQRLYTMSRASQVIVVTHLAQVAAYADHQIVVEKERSEAGAVTLVRSVDDDERIGELARMLAGNDSQTARAHAAELLSGISMAR